MGFSLSIPREGERKEGKEEKFKRMVITKGQLWGKALQQMGGVLIRSSLFYSLTWGIET